MDLTQIGQFIAQWGFPIVVCLILFNYLDKERENHKEEIESLRKCIDENNIVLSGIKMLMESIERRLDNGD